MNSLILSFFLGFAVFGVDRITKYFAQTGAFRKYSSDYLSFDLTLNRGISWGWFHADNVMQFFLVSAVIAGIIFWLAYTTVQRWRQREPIWSYSLVLGAALSNLLDRVLYGGVIDFIEISYKGWSWPVFNVADMIIVFGISCIVIQELRQ